MTADRQGFAEEVEETVRRQVDAPRGIDAGDQADRARGDERLERVVRQSFSLLT
jgi:hypothetical protein